jgi:AraC-like DNA-binding protein
MISHHVSEEAGPMGRSFGGTALPSKGPRDHLPLYALSADPLSEAIEGLGLRSWVPGPFTLTAPWGVRSRGDLGWSFLVTSGECRVEVEGGEGAVLLGPGDLIIVLQGHAQRIHDGGGGACVPIESLLKPGHFEDRTPLAHGGGGVLASLACICFLLDDRSGSPLLASLPPLLCVKAERGRPPAYVDYLFRLITQESVSGQSCAQTIINRLVRILLIRAVYHHAAQLPFVQRGWLRALLDPDIGQALAVMHRRPEVPWTVASLADEVAMSRSAFSARFVAMLGRPPLEYLTAWRMQRACVLLTTGEAGLKEIATQVGYDSAAAFSKAFTRWAGTSPTVYRDRMRIGSTYSRVPPILA